jgi:hypothetical protein
MATEQRTPAVLSDEERQKFERDGYLVFDPGIGEETLDAVRADLEDEYIWEGGEDRFDPSGVVYGAATNPRIRQAWKISENVKGLALAPKALATLEALYGRKPLCFQTLNFPRPTGQLPHMDAMHFNSDPPTFMCGVWIALEDMDMDNGPLVYYPGSHKLSLPTWGKEIPDPDRSEFPDRLAALAARHKEFERYCQELIEREGLEPEYATIKKGKAMIWAADLLHGGSPARDRNRSRHSQVNHYFFEGTRHWVPIHRDSEHGGYFYPEWVREDSTKDPTTMMREAVEAHVPKDATVLVSSNGNEELLRSIGREAWHFPQAEDGSHLPEKPEGSLGPEQLESLREKGADYIVFPKDELWWLENQYTELQNRLEERYRGVFRDGGACVIFDIR